MKLWEYQIGIYDCYFLGCLLGVGDLVLIIKLIDQYLVFRQDKNFMYSCKNQKKIFEILYFKIIYLLKIILFLSMFNLYCFLLNYFKSYFSLFF